MEGAGRSPPHFVHSLVNGRPSITRPLSLSVPIPRLHDISVQWFYSAVNMKANRNSQLLLHLCWVATTVREPF
jgi:hypothetical protein